MTQVGNKLTLQKQKTNNEMVINRGLSFQNLTCVFKTIIKNIKEEIWRQTVWFIDIIFKNKMVMTQVVQKKN